MVSEAMIGCISNRVKPELCHIVIPLYMDMRWFVVLIAKEQEGIGTNPQNNWHSCTLSYLNLR